jgi:dTDP-4-amino-4,6-dideoxygalactose transaminase
MKKAKMLRDWGQEKRYHHVLEGYNYRMDNIQGAILRIKLRHLPAWTEARRAHAALYRELFAGSRVHAPAEMPYAKHVYHIYAILSKDPAALHQALGDRGVATGFHYPIPVHLQPCFAHLGHKKGDFPVTEKVASEELSLPMFAELTDEQVREVAAAAKDLA